MTSALLFWPYGIGMALIWGIFVATYSSVFICSPMLIYLGLRGDTVGPAPAPAG